MSAKLTKQLSFALLDSGNVVVSAAADNPNAQIVVTVTGMGFFSGITLYRVVNSVRTSIRGAVNTPIGGVSSLVFFDYEAPLDVNVSYVAVLDDSLEVGSNTVSVVTDGRTFWLKDVILGAFSCKVNMEEMSDVVYPANVLGSFKVLGRPNPIIVTDVRQGRTGTMTLSSFSLADRTALLDILASGNTLLLQCPASANFPDMYFQAGDVSQTWLGISSTPYHSWSVPFTETDAPSGSAFSLANNSWLLVTQFTDWQDVLDKRLTWKDVLVTPFSDSDI